MSHVQSILFDKNIYTVEKSRKWLKDHNYRTSKVHTTDKYHRWRQISPVKNKMYRTIPVNKGIKFIISI